jgi:hypothetical protein
MHLLNLVKHYYTPQLKYFLLMNQIAYATNESINFLKKEYHIRPDIYDDITMGGLIGTPMALITHLFPMAPLTGFPIFFLWQKSCEQTLNKIRK